MNLAGMYGFFTGMVPEIEQQTFELESAARTFTTPMGTCQICTNSAPVLSLATVLLVDVEMDVHESCVDSHCPPKTFSVVTWAEHDVTPLSRARIKESQLGYPSVP